MDKDKIAVTAIILLLLAFFVGGSVYAWYSDVKEIEDNQFTAGTLYLNVGGSGSTPVDFDNVYPGWNSDVQTITLKNVGTINGKLKMSFGSFSGDENLSKALNVTISHDNNDPVYSLYTIEHNINTETGESSSDVWHMDLGDLAAGNSITIGLTYSIGEDVGNEIMGETCGFNVVFTLDQDQSNPVTAP